MNDRSNNGQAKITISDIARDSGVSPATVSLVLRDKPGISDETRQRVLDTAQRLGYVHKLSWPSTIHAEIHSVGLLLKTRPDDILETNQFYAPVLAGIEATCRQRHINLIYAHLPVDEENNLLEPPRLLRRQEAGGLLLVGAHLNEAMLAVFQPQSMPVVLVDAYADGDPFDAVVTDNVAGAYQATSYLIQNGHRQIAIAGSQSHAYPSIQERREGYTRAITENQLKPHFVDSPLHWEAAVPATLVYLQQHPEVTAIFACNDEIAIAIMRALQAQGKTIPDDLSIIGFDNVLLAQHVTPALTTMRVDKMGMGRLAAQLLFNRIEFPAAGAVRTVIRPSLIERNSVKSVAE
ncbi:MAG: LacI family transcriptional regulator [Chloroflexi bacterium]|nr:LacI family transcriptional regulator [Chloroflexota bacterium]MCI0575441.1 LacI family transcriptional regulator [Chloroflexota bacterium]MCI0649877.1 LacI family transcriptional regulator [Chloroflexota bacterium]MCI0725647.1 LacI family transcriptional regulator [Chloroflexota bacterium]